MLVDIRFKDIKIIVLWEAILWQLIPKKRSSGKETLVMKLPFAERKTETERMVAFSVIGKPCFSYKCFGRRH